MKGGKKQNQACNEKNRFGFEPRINTQCFKNSAKLFHVGCVVQQNQIQNFLVVLGFNRNKMWNFFNIMNREDQCVSFLHSPWGLYTDLLSTFLSLPALLLVTSVVAYLTDLASPCIPMLPFPSPPHSSLYLKPRQSADGQGKESCLETKWAGPLNMLFLKPRIVAATSSLSPPPSFQCLPFLISQQLLPLAFIHDLNPEVLNRSSAEYHGKIE